MEKEALVENVNSWVNLDDEINRLQHELRELKKKKMSITNILVDVMRKNNVDSFDMKDESLLYKKQTIKQSINKKMLLTALQKMYKDDEVEKIIDCVLEQRTVKTKETIRRKN
uniref:Uncharacterized protein n=1 Tax=viral metagenome TaxID=1070528 RepID=A0A6C0HRD9_9ZZZZ